MAPLPYDPDARPYSANDFRRDAFSTLSDNLRKKAGSILMSSLSYSVPSCIYAMGCNGGGKASDVPSTIQQDIENLGGGRWESSGWSDLDEHWGNSPPGQRQYQLVTKRALQLLGYPDHHVAFLTNALFARSINNAGRGGCEEIFRELPPNEQNECWDLHRLLLSQVRPREILALGNGEGAGAYYFLRNRVGESGFCLPFGRPLPVPGYGSSFFKFFRISFQSQNWSFQCGLVTIPHPSTFWWKLENEATFVDRLNDYRNWMNSPRSFPQGP